MIILFIENKLKINWFKYLEELIIIRRSDTIRLFSTTTVLMLYGRYSGTFKEFI